MPVMTDEGAETVADGAEVEDADETLTVTTEDDALDVDVDGAADTDLDGVAAAAEEPAATAATASRDSIKRLIAIGVLSVLIATIGALGWQVWQQHQVDKAAKEGQRAAVAYAQVLTSIDSNKVDENFKEVIDGATGEFKDMYSQSSVELRQLLVENKATAHGVVVDSAVQEASKNKVVVLLFVDQSVSNTKLPDPRIDRSRMKMTLEKVDGRWRASKVELP